MIPHQPLNRKPKEDDTQMGFFSYDCKGCHHSLRSHGAINSTSAWMVDAVVMTKFGDRLVGEYDGYGRINGRDIDDDQPEAWHRACWGIAGKPDYTGPSRSAHDQGHFVGEYDPAQPKTADDVNTLAAEAERLIAKFRDDMRRLSAALKADKKDGGQS